MENSPSTAHIHNNANQEEELRRQAGGWTVNLLLCCVTCALCGALPFGFNASSLSGVAPVVRNFIATEAFIFESFHVKRLVCSPPGVTTSSATGLSSKRYSLPLSLSLSSCVWSLSPNTTNFVLRTNNSTRWITRPTRQIWPPAECCRVLSRSSSSISSSSRMLAKRQKEIQVNMSKLLNTIWVYCV